MLTAFRFELPSGTYDPMKCRQALLLHPLIQDFWAFLRYRISGSTPFFMQAHTDEQGDWLPLKDTIMALDIEALPEDLFPLPQPRPRGWHNPQTNPWLNTLESSIPL